MMDSLTRGTRAATVAGAVPHTSLVYGLLLIPLTVLLIFLLAACAADAALVRPWDGTGDFSYVLDVVERPREDGVVDLVLLFSVPNAELRFQEEWGGGQRGKLAVTASLRSDHGTVAREVELDLIARSRGDASAQTAYQVFTLTLPDVTCQVGYLRCELRDLEAGRVLHLSEADAADPSSVVEGEWYRDEARQEGHGLWLGSPLYLAGAPSQEIAASHADDARPEHTLLGRFLHPNRRYGIEQSTLQIVFDIEALGLTQENAGHLPRNLLVQLLSTELDYAMRDTVALDLEPAAFVARGGLAEIAWEYDVNNLPPGTYQLSCAPLDGYGNSWLTEFDVFWSLQSFSRPADEQFLIGSIVLLGDRRDAFGRAGDSGREAILAKFWDENDPDPDTPGNEALVEFRRRMSYVSQFLGGFGRSGPIDDRGLIYLMLGEPDEVQQEVIPINSRSFLDAIDRVYTSFLNVNYGEVMHDDYSSEAQTQQAVRQRLNRATSIETFKSFELWIYHSNGAQLFRNAYSGMPLGQRFLFLARLGGSAYHLELTSDWDQGTPGP